MNDIEREKKLNKIHKAGTIVNILFLVFTITIEILLRGTGQGVIAGFGLIIFMLTQLTLECNCGPYRWRPGQGP